MAELRTLMNRLHWASADGCYAASDVFHIVVRPCPTTPAQPCTVVIAVRPRLADVALPANVAFVLRSDGQPGLLHYGHLSPVGHAQIRSVTPGRLSLYSASVSEAALYPELRAALTPTWALDTSGSAFAAHVERIGLELPAFQNAAGDLHMQFERAEPATQLLVTAYGDQWTHAIIPISWEQVGAGHVAELRQALLPLSWHQSLECWAGRMQLGVGPILRFAPAQASLDRAVIAALPADLIRAAVEAAASMLTQQAWQALSADPVLPAAIRGAIREQLGMS